MHFSCAIHLSSMNHNELHSFLVGDIRCRAIACKYNVDSLDVFGARMGLATSSLLLAAGAASGTLPLTQFGLLRGLCIGSAAAGLWGAAQGTAIISVQDVPRVLKWNDLKVTQQQVRWCDTMQTITAELTATHDEGIYVMHVLQYGDQCVAFGRHHGNTFYIDVHGSKRLPRPGVFLVHFKCIEDLVNHGIKADTSSSSSTSCTSSSTPDGMPVVGTGRTKKYTKTSTRISSTQQPSAKPAAKRRTASQPVAHSAKRARQ